MMIAEARLQSAAARANEALVRTAEAGYAPETPQRPSPAFEKKIERLCRRTRHPYFHRGMQRAASILLVASLVLGGVMLTSPAARAAAHAAANRIVTWSEKQSIFRYMGGDITEKMPRYEITALPEGYVEIESKRIDYSTAVHLWYENGAGNILTLDYTYMQQGSLTQIIPGDDTVSEVTVNQMEGLLFVPQNPESACAVTWIDPEENLQFSVRGFFNEADILHIAESVSLENSPN